MTRFPLSRTGSRSISRDVVILIFEDAQILDITGPVAAFEIARDLVLGSYRIRVVSTKAGLVRTSSGVAMAADQCDAGTSCDTLIVVGGVGTDRALNDPVVLEFVRETARYARRIASICSGTYVLAAAGLLDGRRATTHWVCSRDFQRRFPKVRLECDQIYVRDGSVWTSGGVTAGIDLALALIAEDCGDEISRTVARYLVVPHRRMGGQSQFSPLLELETEAGKFHELLRWASAHLDHSLSVEELADKVGMSPRNFSRSFRLDTGTTPAKAIERLRIDHARALLEDAAGGSSVEEIAKRSGFGETERMRRSFLRIFGRPPQTFRSAVRT